MSTINGIKIMGTQQKNIEKQFRNLVLQSITEKVLSYFKLSE
jgi:GTP-sensing pleiotropic transcriptional regulator CodY